MLASELTVEVRGRALDGSGTVLDRQGQILTRDLNLNAKLRWCGVGEWTVILPGNHPMVPYLMQPGSGLIVSDSLGVVFSGPTLAPNRKRNVESPGGMLTFKGVTDEIHLQDALAYPDPQGSSDPTLQTDANDVRVGTTEDLLRQYVAYNITYDQALPGRVRGFRQYIDLAGTSLGRGVVTSRSPRYQNLLELLQGLAVEATLGFRMVQQDDKILFEIVPVRDLRGTIRLDVNTGTITSEEVEIQGPALTYPIIAGQGEGVDRTMRVVRNTEVIDAESTWSRVIEGFFDRRDTNDPVELDAKGVEELANAAGGTSAKIVPSDDQTMQYRKDWNVGDWITVVVSGVEDPEKWSVATEVVILADDTKTAVGLGVGDVTSFDPRDVQTSKQDTLDSRIGYLERVTGSGRKVKALLDPAYVGPGPAKISILPSTTLSPVAYEWQGGYLPWGNRVVDVEWRDDTWVILGHSYDSNYGGKVPIPLANGYLTYNFRNALPDNRYAIPLAQRLVSGIVVLSGLVGYGPSAHGTVVGTLPANMRPDTNMLFGVNNGDTPRTITIKPNGDICVEGANFNGATYVSLDGIAFPAAGVATWTNVGAAGSGSAFQNSWVGFNTATWGAPRYWKDPYGFVWFAGLVGGGASTTDNTPMFTLPATHQPSAQLHLHAASNNLFGYVGSQPGQGINWKNGTSSNVWVSLCGIVIPATEGNVWQTPALANGWTAYGAGFSVPGILRRGDGLGMAKGLMKGGTTPSIKVMNAREEMSNRRGILLAGVSSALFARLDIYSRDWSGDDDRSSMRVQGGSATWASWDGIVWMVD